MMSRLLASLPDTEAILGNYNSLTSHPDAELPVEIIEDIHELAQSTTVLWNRRGDQKQTDLARERFSEAVHRVRTSPKLADTANIVLKRSAPFFDGDLHRPDLFDMIEVAPDVRILLMTRDPKASTYSAFRRRFADNLRHAATMCEDQLLQLNGKLKAISANQIRVINYEKFCSEYALQCDQIAEFLGLNQHKLKVAAHALGIKASQNKLWQKELNTHDRQFLDKYFSPARLSQFDELGLLPSQP